jgi:hypothetical protein
MNKSLTFRLVMGLRVILFWLLAVFSEASCFGFI